MRAAVIGRVGDVGVDALGRDPVPLAPAREQRAQRRPGQRVARRQRRLALAPRVAERVVAVADVGRAGIDQHAVRPRARGRDDDVVAAQVERLDRAGYIGSSGRNVRAVGRSRCRNDACGERAAKRPSVPASS